LSNCFLRAVDKVSQNFGSPLRRYSPEAVLIRRRKAIPVFRVFTRLRWSFESASSYANSRNREKIQLRSVRKNVFKDLSP